MPHVSVLGRKSRRRMGTGFRADSAGRCTSRSQVRQRIMAARREGISGRRDVDRQRLDAETVGREFRLLHNGSRVSRCAEY